jgi:hypothetical protein
VLLTVYRLVQYNINLILINKSLLLIIEFTYNTMYQKSTKQCLLLKHRHENNIAGRPSSCCPRAEAKAQQSYNRRPALFGRCRPSGFARRTVLFDLSSFLTWQILASWLMSAGIEPSVPGLGQRNRPIINNRAQLTNLV